MTAEAPTKRSHVRHPVLFVALLAAAVRLLVLADLPLIISNDGVGYLSTARDILNGRLDTIPAVKTPGYPAFLAGVFGTLGLGGLSVLIAQHAVGVGTVTVLTLALERRHGRRWALGLGSIAALSPSLMVWECYALTETLTAFFVVLAFAIALCARPRLAWGVALGVVLGLACLVRPTMQLLIPLFALGWAWRLRGSVGQRTVAALAVAGGVLASTGPWLAYNTQRGVTGMARGGGVAFWWGLGLHGALDPSFTLPPNMRAAAVRLPKGPATAPQLAQFLTDTGTPGNAELEAVLSAWARSSVQKRPLAYAKGAVRTLSGQLDMGAGNDTAWALERAARDGRELGQAAGNFQVSEYSPELEPFRMEGGRGLSARAAESLAHSQIGGLPRIPLLLGAIVGGVSMALRRRWGEALVVLGTGGLFMLHVALLLPHGRYGLPACVCWILLIPEAALAITYLARNARRQRRTVQVQPAANEFRKH